MPTLFDLIANMETEKEAVAAGMAPKPKPGSPKRTSLDKEDRNKRAVEKKLLSGLWDTEIPIDKKKISDMIARAAEVSGYKKPEVLYSSAYEEGLRDTKYITNDPEFTVNLYDGGYVVDGYTKVGVDTFGEKAEKLKKKGYIPQDFDFMPHKVMNDSKKNPIPVTSGYFKTVEDALIAKGAMMRDLEDDVVSYAKKKGVSLEGDALDYVVMAGYNGGPGGYMHMINEIQKQRIDPNVYVNEGRTSRRDIEAHIRPRMRYINIMRELAQERAAQGGALPAQAPAIGVAPVQPITDGTLGLINRGL
jgi:hypothetical protein